MASNLFGTGRLRWHPGELAWDLAGSDRIDVTFYPDGFAWREDYLCVVATEEATIVDALDQGQGGLGVQVLENDALLLEEVGRRRLPELVAAPFELDLRLGVWRAMPPRPPDDYRVRSARSGDDLVGVHRASWRPADLPYIPGRGPELDPEATSGFNEEKMAAVRRERLYREELHMVVEAPDGSLVASCIAWLDPGCGVAAIEPLGVHPDHRRMGLAGVLCLGAAQAVGDAGDQELVIHPRGDDDYPAPRAAYRRCGFRPVSRTRIYGWD